MVWGQSETGMRCHDRWVRDQHGQAVCRLTGQIFVGPDRDDTFNIDGACDVDIDDVSVGVRAPHEGAATLPLARSSR